MINYFMATTTTGTVATAEKAKSPSRKTKATGRQARDRVRVTVYLDEPLANWGKQQEGGLSELLRRLLVDARQEQSQTPSHYPPELMAPYKRLIDKKLAQGLTHEEEQELTQVRERMGAFDRALPSWERSEAIAAAIDQEFADIRALIESSPKKRRAGQAEF
jgi:hypothetical protein